LSTLYFANFIVVKEKIFLTIQ